MPRTPQVHLAAPTSTPILPTSRRASPIGALLLWLDRLQGLLPAEPPWSAACRHHAPVHTLLTGLVATCATCGGNAVPRIEAESAMRIAGPERVGWLPRVCVPLPHSPSPSCTKCLDPTWVRRFLMPSGFQTSAPSSTTFEERRPVPHFGLASVQPVASSGLHLLIQHVVHRTGAT